MREVHRARESEGEGTEMRRVEWGVEKPGGMGESVRVRVRVRERERERECKGMWSLGMEKRKAGERRRRARGLVFTHRRSRNCGRLGPP